jgi:hypothetical protein
MFRFAALSPLQLLSVASIGIGSMLWFELLKAITKATGLGARGSLAKRHGASSSGRR